ncbi:MAG: flagellar basal body rod protein FlgB [Deltaproteobacteria bacterium]|nr:flagellar basal body rod protein FlgB [Deltaproteobacteria bacterium]
MPIKTLFGKTYGIVERSLEIAKLRHGVIASNVANVATPGYKAKDLDFDQALHHALEERSVPMSRTHPLHFPARRLGTADYEIVEEDHAGVDIDREMSKLAENNLRYQSGIEALLRKFSILKQAIIEGGR